MPDGPVLMCLRTTAGSRVPQGSQRREASCGHEVWVAPSGIGMLERGEVRRIVCVQCGAEEARRDPEGAEAMPPTAAQLAELSLHLRRRRP